MSATTDAMLMMAPLPRATNSGAAARVEARECDHVHLDHLLEDVGVRIEKRHPVRRGRRC